MEQDSGQLLIVLSTSRTNLVTCRMKRTITYTITTDQLSEIPGMEHTSNLADAIRLWNRVGNDQRKLVEITTSSVRKTFVSIMEV